MHGYLRFRIANEANHELLRGWVNQGVTTDEVDVAVQASQATTGKADVALSYVAQVVSSNRRPARIAAASSPATESPEERAARIVRDWDNEPDQQTRTNLLEVVSEQ